MHKKAIERKAKMNILILQGSPRANGNTAWMAEEYRRTPDDDEAYVF